MRILLRLLALFTAVFGLAIGLGDATQSDGLSAGDPTDLPVARPAILKVEPDVATPWSYVVISGQNLMGADGSCSVAMGGVFSYVVDCSPSEIRAVVPWAAQTGDVAVSAEGVVRYIDVSPMTKIPDTEPCLAALKG